MASSASSTFTSIQSIQRPIAFALGVTNFPLVLSIYALFFLLTVLLPLLLHLLLLLLPLLVDHFSQFEPSAATAAALCISFCYLQHLLCMPHALGAPAPPFPLHTLFTKRGCPLRHANANLVHFTLCRAATDAASASAASAASCCCYSKKTLAGVGFLGLPQLTLSSPLFPLPLPPPSL